MKTYLVTGEAGFTGCNFIKYMFAKYNNKINIINLDKLTYASNLENLKEIETRENYIFIKTDICNSKIVDTIFKKYHPDYVVNFAAENHLDRSIEDPSIFIKSNALGTQVLLNATLKDGIESTINWYLENLNWMKEITSGEYKNYYQKFYGNRKLVNGK